MIQVIARVAYLIEKLAADEELTLAQLADHAKLNHGTACNILRSLVETGWLTKNAHGKYSLSDSFRQLGCTPEWEPRLKGALEQYAQKLSQKIRESVVISTLHYSKVIIITQAKYQHTLMINDERLYKRLSLYTSVSGELLCAYLPRDIRQALYKFIPPTENDLKDDGTLECHDEKLERIRREQHNISVNESMGIKSWALPITDANQNICACLGLSVPLIRLPLDQGESMFNEMLHTASAISSWLSHNNFHSSDFIHLPSSFHTLP